MLTAAAGSVAPKTRKGRTATVRPSTNLLISSACEDSVTAARAQYPVLIPRIIATHWLRPEMTEAAHD